MSIVSIIQPTLLRQSPTDNGPRLQSPRRARSSQEPLLHQPPPPVPRTAHHQNPPHRRRSLRRCHPRRVLSSDPPSKHFIHPRKICPHDASPPLSLPSWPAIAFPSSKNTIRPWRARLQEQVNYLPRRRTWTTERRRYAEAKGEG